MTTLPVLAARFEKLTALAGSGIVIVIDQLPKLLGISPDPDYPSVIGGIVRELGDNSRLQARARTRTIGELLVCRC